MAQRKARKKQQSLPVSMLVVVLILTSALAIGIWLLFSKKMNDNRQTAEAPLDTGTQQATDLTAPNDTMPAAEGTSDTTSDTGVTDLTEQTAAVSDAYGTEKTTAATKQAAPGAVTGIKLTFYSKELNVGDAPVMPIVTMEPADAKDKSEKWESTDEKVATVDWQGSITPVGKGKCKIRVTSVSNPTVYADVEITVKDGTGTAASQSGTEKQTTTTDSSRSDIKVIDGITYVQGLMIVNKTYSLPATYNPGGMTQETREAFAELQKAAYSEQGLSMNSVSDFRSYDFQKQLYSNYVARDGRAAADTYSARAGHSEHQTGMAIDVNCAGDAFNNTPEAKWLAENSWKYGFIIRYPQGKENITGYKYESWHIRYVGKEWAKKIYDSGLTMEEYFNLTSQYAE